MALGRTQKKYLIGFLILLSISGVAFLGWYLAGKKIKEEKETKPSTTFSPPPLPSPTFSASPSPVVPPLSNFDYTPKKGDISKLGGYYLITDIRFSSHSKEGYERVVVDLKSLSELPPYYQVKEINTEKEPILDVQGEKITDLNLFVLETILTDTRTFDIDRGEATYTKDKAPFSGEVIKEARIIPLGDDNNSRVVLNLNKETPFLVSVLSSPWRIVIDVKI